jgi:hypothetical protein
MSAVFFGFTGGHNLMAADEPSNVPQAEISNEVIHAKLFLPDAERGYYRGSRFDWSGVIASLEYDGHNYFGRWFEHYDPKLHDAITGPVEEFRNDEGALGYNEAKAGGTFIKIGVGVLRKPQEARYAFSNPYEIVDGGKWKVNAKKDYVEFTQKLTDASGYAYEYKKTVRLVKGKPQLVLEHSLKNTGKRSIKTSVYNHDFYVMDNQPTGPDYSVRFPFKPQAKEGFGDKAEIQGNDLVYLRELQPRESAASYLEGYGSSASDFDFRVENQKTKAGVRQTADRPVSKLYLWSVRTTICPEGYIDLSVEPGQKTEWKMTYEFYTVGKTAQ